MVIIPREWQSLAQSGGTMKCSMMKETYVKRIWKRRPGGFFNTGKSILLMDSAKSHLGDEVEQAFTDVNSSIKIAVSAVIAVSGCSRKQTI